MNDIPTLSAFLRSIRIISELTFSGTELRMTGILIFSMTSTRLEKHYLKDSMIVRKFCFIDYLKREAL